MAPQNPLKQEKKSAAEMRSPEAGKTETGDIKIFLFTLHLTELFLAEDIEMGDLVQDNTDQDEEESDPELREIRQSMLNEGIMNFKNCIE